MYNKDYKLIFLVIENYLTYVRNFPLENQTRRTINIMEKTILKVEKKIWSKKMWKG